MAGISAVVFIPDDTSKTGYTRPLMLQRMMGSPLLSWLISSLQAEGVGRFFLVCHDRYLTEARACFPADVELQTSGNQNAADVLHVFLSTAEDEQSDVVVVTGPALLLRAAAVTSSLARPVSSCVYGVNRDALMQALDMTENFDFMEFLHNRGTAFTDRDGVFTITSTEELAQWQPVLNRSHMLQLVRSGVEIWDCDRCYADPQVFVSPGSVLMPGVILRGQTVVGRDCVIGPDVLLESVKVGDGSRVSQSRISGSNLGFDVQVGPYCRLGPDVNVGNGACIESFVSLAQQTVPDGAVVKKQ